MKISELCILPLITLPEFIDLPDYKPNLIAKLRSRFIEQLGLKFNEITGKWDCDGDLTLTQLKLAGIPFNLGIVKGFFDCSNSGLTSLEGSPDECTQFFCNGNQLTSLKGAPTKCKYFMCYDNKLASLEGGPTIVDFYYCHNNKLTSLEGAPDECEYFWCQNNELTSLKGVPKTDFLNCSSNRLTSLEDISDIYRLYCHNNKLNLDYLPNSVRVLECDSWLEPKKYNVVVNEHRSKTYYL